MASSLSPQTSSKESSYRPLEGKLAIITGASRGIGAAIAHNLASKGASLVLNYSSASSAAPTKALSTALHQTYSTPCLIVQADVGSPSGPAELVAATQAHFQSRSGTFQIDIIINNAGIAPNDFLPAVKASDFHLCYAVNVLGPLLLMQAAQPFLPTDRSGRIINVSSVSSSMGFVGQSVYGGTKAALEAMTRTWARELAENATVNAVNPGPVKTDMWSSNSDAFLAGIKPFIQTTPLQAVRAGVDGAEELENAEAAGGRPAYVEEIASVVGLLCGAEAAWITGQVVCANGGMRFSS